MSHSVYIYVMCFDQVVETGVSCHVCAGEEVSGNLLRFSKMCPGGIFKNVSRGNAFDFEDFEDFQKCFQGECTSADDGGSSVDCGAGIYTCLIARTSNLPPRHIIGQFAGYHVLIKC